MFETQGAATAAVTGLQANSELEVAYARLATNPRQPAEPAKDPSNLYFSNLPENYQDAELRALVESFGQVVSSRILRDYNSGGSRGVGFARMETMAICETIVMSLNGQMLDGATGALICKFADMPQGRKPFRPRFPTISPAVTQPSHYVSAGYSNVFVDAFGHSHHMQPFPQQYYPQSIYTQLMYPSPVPLSLYPSGLPTELGLGPYPMSFASLPNTLVLSRAQISALALANPFNHPAPSPAPVLARALGLASAPAAVLSLVASDGRALVPAPAVPNPTLSPAPAPTPASADRCADEVPLVDKQ